MCSHSLSPAPPWIAIAQRWAGSAPSLPDAEVAANAATFTTHKAAKRNKADSVFRRRSIMPTILTLTTMQKAPPDSAGLLFEADSFSYTLKLEPQPQVDFTWGFSNLNPAASSVST